MTNRYRVSNLQLPLDFTQAQLENRLAKIIGTGAEAITSAKVTRESVDARKGAQFVVQVEFITQQPLGKDLPTNVTAAKESHFSCITPSIFQPKTPPRSESTPTIVIGAGPAGLFAALALGEAGRKVILIERGKPVETRMRDIGLLRSKGSLNPESNVCFGEGGAGTYSDGKLVTRIKNPLKWWVLHQLIRFGAPSEILVKAHPHLGTDRLKGILQSMRSHLIEKGVEFIFETRMTNLVVHQKKAIGVRLSSGEEVHGSQVVLAIGHSARDTYEHLHEIGVRLEAKAFAVGLRVEHPQELIDRAQWGKAAGHPRLGAAQYRLAHQIPEPDGFHRGVYSFCMCPGGFIIPTPTEPEHMVINGMSHASRATGFANSGIVVQVRKQDLLARGYDDHPLMGMFFQKELENATFEATEQAYGAPAMRVSDFVRRKPSGNLAPTRFRPRAEATDLWEILPEWILEPLSKGLKAFENKIRGFVSNEGNLMAVESRTSSPVRITRNENMTSVSVKGLYPVGEGAGYAGGIVSSAVDGLRAAEAILKKN